VVRERQAQAGGGQVNEARRKLFSQTEGWLTDAEGEALERYALECDGPFIEIGSYCGKSTLWLGSAAEQKQTHLFAIDNRRGCPPQFTDVGDGLVRTLRKAELMDSVIPIIGDAAKVAHYMAPSFDFCFIDGDHSPDAVSRDFDAWGQYSLKYVAFHDSTETGPAAVLADVKMLGWATVAVVNSLTVLRVPT